MKSNGMIEIACIVLISLASGVYCQENSLKKIPPSLLECYNNSRLLDRENRLPHTIDTLIEILRKIEQHQNYYNTMDLTTFTVAILHKFRQDGIERSPFPTAELVTPYAPHGFQFSRHSQVLKLIPGNAYHFPNESITDIEKCTLHFMLSSSIDIFERGNEGTTCRSINYRRYRRARHAGADDGDVETLTKEEIDRISNKENPEEGSFDPNSVYPELPPNHPSLAKLLAELPRSRCPIENGVMQTDYGVVSPGALVAAIAAALSPQEVAIAQLLSSDAKERGYPGSKTLDNKWLATFAGDLAEVALRQGPRANQVLKLGAEGHWNSSVAPKWYFLNSNENLELTAAEIRGDLDGLIIADELKSWYQRLQNLMLSQIIDMYYKGRGVFSTDRRACNRRTMLTKVAPKDKIVAQTYSASMVLDDIAIATIDPQKLENLAEQVTDELLKHIPSKMNSDPSCSNTSVTSVKDTAAEPHVDLTIVVDTNWPYQALQPILETVIKNIEVSPYNSNFSIVNAHDGLWMINSTRTKLSFHNFTESFYANHTRGLDLPKILERLRISRAEKMNEEHRRGIGGGHSDVVLIVPYTTSISDSDKEYSTELLKQIREEFPDVTLLFLTYGSKDRWSSFVLDPPKDIFSIGIGSTNDALAPLIPLINRIQLVPRRLANSQCDASYSSSGSPSSYTSYVQPSGVDIFRLHPNFFHDRDGDRKSTIKIQGFGYGTLKVCTSREPIYATNNTGSSETNCATINNNVHTVEFNCNGADYIHQCKPLYVLISAETLGTPSNSVFQCTDPRVCRFPDNIKYTISFENLLCTNLASSVMSSAILVLSLLYISFYFSH